eukprot:4465178-Pleurochrysis_carterae.AAC.1
MGWRWRTANAEGGRSEYTENATGLQGGARARGTQGERKGNARGRQWGSQRKGNARGECTRETHEGKRTRGTHLICAIRKSARLEELDGRRLSVKQGSAKSSSAS